MSRRDIWNRTSGALAAPEAGDPPEDFYPRRANYYTSRKRRNKIGAFLYQFPEAVATALAEPLAGVAETGHSRPAVRIAPDHPLTFTLPTARMYVEHHRTPHPMSRDAAHEPVSPLTTLPALDTFRERTAVDWDETTKDVPADEFDGLYDDLASTDGWAVVGLANDTGAVLLMDDGQHGWTLPAIPVRDGDWVDRAREVVEGLTGRTADLVGVERVRRLDYHEDGGDRHVTIHHVVLRAEQVSGAPVADEPTVGCDGHPEVGWFDALPDDVEGAVAADARLVL